jgi:hypothetical protein
MVKADHGIILIGGGGGNKKTKKNRFCMPLNITDNKPHIMTPMTYLKDGMGLSWSSRCHTSKAVSTSSASNNNPGLIGLIMSPKGLSSQG